MGVKISDLPAATTPLSGVDTLLVVQGGQTKKAPVSGLPATGLTNPMTTAGDIIVGASGGGPARLGMGSALQVLRVNAAGTSLEYAAPTGGGGGLTDLAEVKVSTSPNATVPVVSLSVSIAETNGDLAIVAKGSGATLAQTPNGSATGGAKRGEYSTDWQKSRGSASQVASGSYAVLCGGRLNTASGQESGVGGGQSNTASGAQSFVGGGISNTASANGTAILGGGDNTASALYSTVLGGQYNVASGQYSSASGRYASTRGIYGARAHAAGSHVQAGDAQIVDYVLRRLTQNDTATELSCDGATPASANRIVLPDNSAVAFKGHVVARKISGGDAKAWEFSGLIRRGSGAATTALVASVTPSVIAEDAAASAWALAVMADTSNGSLAITATGAAGTNIRWTCHVETVDVAG